MLLHAQPVDGGKVAGRSEPAGESRQDGEGGAGMWSG